jgi:hypothetical protein
MFARDIKISWGHYEQINISDIHNDVSRVFIRELTNRPRHFIIDVYLCSDARNHFIRQILSHIPYVNVLNSAGNVVYNPHHRPSVIIAHGDSAYTGCGAIDYAKAHSRDDLHGYPAIASLEPDPLQNAHAQLAKIYPEWRAGIIYFDHEKGVVSMIEGNHDNRGIGLALYSELRKSLKHGFAESELKHMATGQNPDIIFLNNIFTDMTAFNAFTINLQRDSFDGIVYDSLKYAMDHALRGEGSFKDTRVVVLAFRRDEPIPDELHSLLNREVFVREYLNRGGKIYVVTVGDLPSMKTVYRVTNHLD